MQELSKVPSDTGKEAADLVRASTLKIWHSFFQNELWPLDATRAGDFIMVGKNYVGHSIAEHNEQEEANAGVPADTSSI